MILRRSRVICFVVLAGKRIVSHGHAGLFEKRSGYAKL